MRLAGRPSWGSALPITSWAACENPERVPDEHTVFHGRCKGCGIALQAALSVEPRPGQFRGWWDHREEIRGKLAADGLLTF